ncbi:MAG: bifunctional precorrin-2 dehydrogenase/sirohydrochlorin ferrochelatase [Candidatus Acidiferrum sp.]
MTLFPMFVRLQDRLVVVVGAGVIAEGKITGLLQSGARLRVIAPEVTPRIAALIAEKKIDWCARTFAAGDLQGASLVVASTSAPGVNASVFREAEALGIFCNAVDDIENCHFYYGALVQRGDLQIAVSTNGKSPALAQRIRKELERLYPEEYSLWLEWLGAARDLLRTDPAANTEENKAILHHLASREMFDRFFRQVSSSVRSAARGTQKPARSGHPSASPEMPDDATQKKTRTKGMA